MSTMLVAVSRSRRRASFHAQFDLVLRRRHPRRLLEEPVEMELAHAGDFRKRGQAEWFGQVFAHPQRYQPQLVGGKGRAIEVRGAHVDVMARQVHGDGVGHAANEEGARVRLRQFPAQACQQRDQFRVLGAGHVPKVRFLRSLAIDFLKCRVKIGMPRRSRTTSRGSADSRRHLKA
jgi:hypothetical protein